MSTHESSQSRRRPSVVTGLASAYLTVSSRKISTARIGEHGTFAPALL